MLGVVGACSGGIGNGWQGVSPKKRRLLAKAWVGKTVESREREREREKFSMDYMKLGISIHDYILPIRSPDVWCIIPYSMHHSLDHKIRVINIIDKNITLVIEIILYNIN